MSFEPRSGFQLIEQRPWFSINLGSWGALKAEYFLGVDGLSMPLIALSVVIMFIAVISSWTENRNVKGYFILLLILDAAIIGAFSSLDLLLFYLFFEFMLLPMFFLIGIWGGPRREYASIKFFLYTLLGSVLILIVFIGLYLSVNDPETAGQLTHSFRLPTMLDTKNFISNSVLDPNNGWTIGRWSARHWAFLFLLIGFGIKLPTVPVHTWLPDAHVEASTPVSVILAALLLKIGGYGLMRIAYPIFPDAAISMSAVVAALGVTSILYGALTAMASKDLKRLIAYSSVSHMGFVLLGLASATEEGVNGAIYQMVSHGMISAMLFILGGVLYDRTNDRTIGNFSGLASKTPVFFAFTVIGFFASMGLPGFSGFLAEVLVFLGAFKSNSSNGVIHESFAIVATLGLIFGAAYCLWTIQRMFFGAFYLKGSASTITITDTNTRENLMLSVLACLLVFFGIFPQVLLNITEPFASDFASRIIEVGRAFSAKP